MGMASSFEVNVNVPSRRAHVASTERRRSPRVGGVQVGNLVRLTAAVTPTLPTLGLGRGGLARKEISTEKRPYVYVYVVKQTTNLKYVFDLLTLPQVKLHLYGRCLYLSLASRSSRPIVQTSRTPSDMVIGLETRGR